ncbi:hypothetical protein BU14_0402s0008 [Porphyra umbilicalis]|uniref:Uncharacterized protein n=1 Tax=Porphyra umbilicalis TaxID=2786 RepID=A0A1X6NW31_PORUM|nr:hypothetical protein BU14_0402s0008 [Porphyra umbilicalis]|eukprot:OSX72828.1 hypothetical protein BU14_0402s0008 [Porphyra umbilicalis]
MTLARPLLDTAGTRGVVTLVYEKTAHVPHRMSSLWYGTTTFTDRFREAPRRADGGGRSLRIPSLSSGRVMVVGIGECSPVPLYLSRMDLENYACELAATSLLLARYLTACKRLCDQIYEIGRKARWTFGWSGLFACCSNLWTRERVYVAAANGLSLLALGCAPSVAKSFGFLRELATARTP